MLSLRGMVTTGLMVGMGYVGGSVTQERSAGGVRAWAQQTFQQAASSRKECGLAPNGWGGKPACRAPAGGGGGKTACPASQGAWAPAPTGNAPIDAEAASLFQRLQAFQTERQAYHAANGWDPASAARFQAREAELHQEKMAFQPRYQAAMAAKWQKGGGPGCATGGWQKGAGQGCATGVWKKGPGQ